MTLLDKLIEAGQLHFTNGMSFDIISVDSFHDSHEPLIWTKHESYAGKLGFIITRDTGRVKDVSRQGILEHIGVDSLVLTDNTGRKSGPYGFKAFAEFAESCNA